MINRKELINRKYNNEKCIGFDYIVKSNGNRIVTIEFSKSEVREISGVTWDARMIIPRDEYVDSMVYSFKFNVPNEKVYLETIAGIGLRFIQLKMKEEIQFKSTIDFSIGESLIGMLGEPN